MYKLSSYNYFVSEEGKVIYFNGLTTKLFVLNIEEHKRLQVLFQDLLTFENRYPSVFKQFEKWGFIVSESVNEIDILHYRNRCAVFGDRNYMLVINPTLECNFNCWYCYEEHPQGYMNNETIEKVKLHIKYMVEKEKITSLNLSWFGGEPLLYFNEIIYPISLFAKELCESNDIPFYNGATTNASLINETVVHKMSEIDMFNFQITLDGDKMRHDKIRNAKGIPSFDKIVSNINLLLKHIEQAKIILRINYDVQTLIACNMEHVFSLFNKDYRDRIRVDFQRVWQTATSIEGENDKLIELHNSCIDLGYNQKEISGVFSIGSAYTCYTDRIHHAELNYDGKVYRCTARGYTEEFVMGILSESGKINWYEHKMANRYGKSTFENAQCLVCKYLPLCCGPCSQKMIENQDAKEENTCYLQYSEVMPETMILNYYHHIKW